MEIARGVWLYVEGLVRGEAGLVEFLSYGMIASGLVTFAILMGGFKASYGRYSHESFLSKMCVPARIAWFVQEVPSVIVPLYYLCANFETMQTGNIVVVSLFLVHYTQRSFIYSLLIKGGKPTPVHLVAAAFLFCAFNGFMQGAWHSRYALYTSEWETSPLSYFGILVFTFGMVVNVQSDSILRSLRSPGERGYKIPRGGMFEFVSGANFLGECLEWIGFAIAARSLPSVAFAIFTLCNIGPRAVHHHRWYIEKFDDYPKDRRALIPYIL